MAKLNSQYIARRIANLSAEKPELRSSDPSKPVLRSTMSTRNEIPQHWDSSSQRFRAEGYRRHHPDPARQFIRSKSK
jgi:hypothetical protein